MDNRVEEVKREIQEAWCEGDINPKDKFGDFLNRAALRICQLFEKPEPPPEELMKDLLERIAKRIFSFWFISGLIKWENLTPENRERLLKEADQILSLATPILLAEGAKKERERTIKILVELEQKGKLHITPRSLDELMGIDSSKDLFPHAFEG